MVAYIDAAKNAVVSSRWGGPDCGTAEPSPFCDVAGLITTANTLCLICICSCLLSRLRRVPRHITSTLISSYMFMLVIPLLLLGICYFNLICRCSRRFSQTTNIQRARCISSPSPSLTTHMHVLRYSPPRLVRGGYREKKFVFRDVPTY